LYGTVPLAFDVKLFLTLAIISRIYIVVFAWDFNQLRDPQVLENDKTNGQGFFSKSHATIPLKIQHSYLYICFAIDFKNLISLFFRHGWICKHLQILYPTAFCILPTPRIRFRVSFAPSS